MIMTFQFPYGKLKEIKPIIYSQLRTYIDELPENQSEAQDFRDYTGPIDKIVDLVGPIEVKGNVTPYFMNLFTALTEKVANIGKIQNVDTSVNHRCDVHVPGLGLLMMREVKNLDDLCTDKLQEELDKGWRILAICPQPDQRRPDYILGRNAKEDA